MKNTLPLLGLIFLALVACLLYQNYKLQKIQISLLQEQNQLLRVPKVATASPLIKMSKPRIPVGFKLPGT
jgi:hypothetical protein